MNFLPLHQRLVNLKEESELSIVDIARLSNVNKESVANYLRGTSPKLTHLSMLAKGFDTVPFIIFKDGVLQTSSSYADSQTYFFNTISPIIENNSFFENTYVLSNSHIFPLDNIKQNDIRYQRQIDSLSRIAGLDIQYLPSPLSLELIDEGLTSLVVKEISDLPSPHMDYVNL